MVYIISEEHKQRDSISCITGTRANVIRELISLPSQDNVIVADDFGKQIGMLEYLGIPYKVVIGVPDVTTPADFVYINDNEKVCDYQEFNNVMGHIAVNSHMESQHDIGN